MDRQVEIIDIYYDYLIDRRYPVNVLVGGRYSGKSFVLEQLAVINTNTCDRYKLLVIEDVETNIGAGVKDGIEKRAEEFGLESLYTATKVPAEIKHINGNNVLFKGYRTRDQQKQVKSLNEVTAAWYEEAENITYNQFKSLRMQLRGGRPQDRQLFLSLNPINSDGFVNEYFFKKPPSKVFEYFPDGRPKVFEVNIPVEFDGETTVIPCIVICTTHRDNPYLTAEQRAEVEEFKYTDPDMYAMLAECKFIKPQGAYFKEFTIGIHTCEPFEIPAHWRRYRAFDYGLDMLACYWIALDDHGRAYVYKELYESDLIISQAAAKISEMTETKENIYETFAPPDLWNRRQETGKSLAELFGESGLYLSKAANNRVQGWLNLKEWLKVTETADEGKKAGLVIFENCTNLIRCLPQLMRDKADPNDVDSKTNHELTHGPDALRYFVAGRPAPAIAPKEKKVVNFSFEQPRTDISREQIIVI